MLKKLFILFTIMISVGWSATKLAKVSYLEGQSFVVFKGKTKPLKVNMLLKSGAVIRTKESSLVEITYLNGDVARIAPNSELLLEGKEVGKGKPFLKKGNLWSNIKKLSSGTPDYKVKTSVATAAVRGTVFQVETNDSGAAIHLIEGKVDVGPNQSDKAVNKTSETKSWGPPVEINGPQEVTLSQWVSLDPGQLIQVNWDGTYFATESNVKNDEWVKFNLKRDKALKR